MDLPHWAIVFGIRGTHAAFRTRCVLDAHRLYPTPPKRSLFIVGNELMYTQAKILINYLFVLKIMNVFEMYVRSYYDIQRLD